MGRIIKPAFGGTELDDLYEEYVSILVSAAFLKGYAMGAEGLEVNEDSFATAIGEAAEQARESFADEMVRLGRFAKRDDGR